MKPVRTLVIYGIAGLLVVAALVWLFAPFVRTSTQPAVTPCLQSPAPVKQLVKPKKATVVKTEPHVAPSLPDRPVVIHNHNIQQNPTPTSVSPVNPTPAAPSTTIYNYNIQSNLPTLVSPVNPTPDAPSPTPPTAPTPPVKVPTSHTMIPQPASSASELVIYNKTFDSSQFQQIDLATTPVQMKMVVCSKYQGCLWRWVTIYPLSLAKAAAASFLPVCDDNYGCYKRWVTIFAP